MNNLMLLVLPVSIFSTLGCSASPPEKSVRARQAPIAQTDPIMIDGDFPDWGAGAGAPAGADIQTQPGAEARADERYLYLRFAPVSGESATIQAAPFTTRIRIDADGEPETGRKMPTMSATAEIQRPQGVDLLIELSPRNSAGSIGIGSRVTGYDANGSASTLGHADVGFMFLPTYASEQYEARIDRLAPGARQLRSAGTARVTIDQVDEKGAFLWSASAEVELPPAEGARPDEARIPEAPGKSVRVMSSNVLFSSPLKEPAAFERVIGAIKPDVILYQEWFGTPIGQVEGWLNAHAGGGWKVHMPDSKAGVAIATRERIITTYQAVLPPSGEGRPARAVAALIDTDAGELLAISVHLKCCGSAGSEEDRTRIEQAETINAFIRSVHKKHPDAKVVIAGDFNLVGSRAPIEALADSLGAQGENLTPVSTVHLGDSTTVTWNDEKSMFSPGRLDWMLIDPSMSAPANAFVLDTRVLAPASLRALGLMADDSKASDHLPIVMDLVGTD